MKKLATLLLAAGMVVASTAPANAVDLKVDARYRLSFATGSVGFTGDNKEDMRHRLRLGLTMAASENLSAYVQFQVNHKNQWGNTDKHGKTGCDDDITARMLYLDWVVPGTSVKVRMGRHQFGLPAEAFGDNSILSAGWGNREGIIVTSPVTDWLGLSAMWARLDTNAGQTAKDGMDVDNNLTDDIFAVAANLKFEGVSGAVYGAYAAMDENIVANSKGWAYNANKVEGDAYWLGFTSTLSFFDPFTLKLSAAYGEFNAAKDSKDDADVWNVQAKASYGLSFGTPVLGAFYFSGVDKDEALMPTAGYFVATRGYHDSAKGLGGLQGYGHTQGFWGVQAGIEGVSFLEGLSHDFLVTYMQGTNDKDAQPDQKGDCGFLTEDDSLVEFNLVNTYKIYKNLAAHLELSYIISDFDDTKKGGRYEGMTEDDWCAQLTFEYKF